MSALHDWLRTNKLESLAETLEANDIDLDILPQLTETDLAEIGVSLGNRRRLLKAISEVGVSAPSAPTPQTTAVGERRQVTVVFCDLADSTALSTKIDPEVLAGLIRRYQDAAAGAIGRFGGFVAKFMGDGVLAYFGFPQAHEEAAERAVQAALAILSETGRIALPDGRCFRARIGIATGQVVVGELIGQGIAQERTIVGETPNLAARLQALARHDSILVSDTTHQLIGDLFETEETGPHDVKGFAAPVTAWRVIGEAPVESRFAAIRQADTPLIGRVHEMGLMLDRWRLARAGEGQVVTVVGEAGIGKSRIVEALQQQARCEALARIHLQCSPYHSDSAFYPVIQHLTRAARFSADDSLDEKLAKLATLFPSDAMEFAAELMSFPAAPSSLTPAQHKAATIAMLTDAILRRSKNNPALVIVEDAHWIDATTLELVTQLADRIGSERVLILVTARTDFAPPWQTRSHATMLTLGRLGRAECAALVSSVALARGLPAATLETIIARTDGVPLFIEELTRSVLETEGQDASAVPATLQDSLMARLDRLGEGREVAQVASVIGRDFTFALLEAVAAKESADLEAALAHLAEAGIVFPRGRGQNYGYSFKHALLRDAAYESLLLSRRREWHEHIARALEARFPEIATNEPELLAHHFGAAGLAAQACDYRERAGDRAAAHSAYREAVAHYSAGVAVAETLSDEVTHQRRQLALLLKLGPAQTILSGAQSAECEATYRRAAAICNELQDDHSAFKVKWGLWLNANVARKTAVAHHEAEELVALAERSGDRDLLLEAYHCRWSTAFFRGEVEATLRYGQTGIEAYDMAKHKHLGPAFGGHDPGVCAHVIAAFAHTLSNDVNSGRAEMDASIQLGEALDHPFSLAHAYFNAAMAAQIGGDRELAERMALQAIALSDKYGFPPYRSGASVCLAWAHACGEHRAASVDLVEREIERAAAAGPNVQYILGVAGEVMLVAGRHGSALELLNRALVANEECDVGYYLAEIRRLRGLCLLALDRGNKAAARRAFTSALDAATHQKALIFADRAEAALGQL